MKFKWSAVPVSPLLCTCSRQPDIDHSVINQIYSFQCLKHGVSSQALDNSEFQNPPIYHLYANSTEKSVEIEQKTIR